MKKILLSLLLACLLACTCGLGALAFADETQERELLVSDDCTTLDDLADKSGNLAIENGIKRTDAADGYIVYHTDRAVGKIEFRAWFDSGKADLDYAIATGGFASFRVCFGCRRCGL